jgi:hypothetical protein
VTFVDVGYSGLDGQTITTSVPRGSGNGGLAVNRGFSDQYLGVTTWQTF